MIWVHTAPINDAMLDDPPALEAYKKVVVNEWLASIPSGYAPVGIYEVIMYYTNFPVFTDETTGEEIAMPKSEYLVEGLIGEE